MRQRILLTLTLVLLVVSASTVFAGLDPGAADTVAFGTAVINSVSRDTTVRIRVWLAFDEPNVMSFNIPLRWSSPDVYPNKDSSNGVDWTVGIGQAGGAKGLTLDIPNQRAYLYSINFMEVWSSGSVATRKTFADVFMKVPAGTAAQCVTLDTTFFPPSSSVSIVSENADDWIPEIKVGKIDILGGCNPPPEITCPGAKTTDVNVLLSFDVAATDSDATIPALTAVNVPAWASFTDHGNGTGTFTGTPGCANSGPYTVKFIASDGQLADTCTVGITVNPDNIPPVITCPADITVPNTAGQCGANVTYTATATDNCGTPTIAYTPPSGSFFPVGTAQVTATATDGQGNTKSCTFNVTVNDTEDPVVTCPANMTKDVDQGQCYATVTYPAIVATDNCGIASVVANPLSGSQFAEGTTTLVTVTATDVHGRTKQCTFNVTVNPVADQFAATPSPLTFNYKIGDPAPASQISNLSLVGCGQAAFLAGTDQPWLHVAPPQGTTPAPLTVSVDITGLAVGTYNGNVTISEGIAAQIPGLLIPVTLHVTGAENVAPQFTNCPSPQDVTEGHLLAFAVGAIDPNAGDNVTYSAENVPAGANVVDSILTWTPGCDQAGQYMVQFIASDGELADTCEVIINVIDDPIQLDAQPTPLTFNYQIGGQLPAPQQVTISNLGCGTIEVSPSGTQPWLHVLPPSGMTPAPFTVSVDVTGLAEGTYNDIISFGVVVRSPGGVPMVQVPVTLHVTKEACNGWASVGTASGTVGSTVDVPVNFKNCVALGGISIPLKWNPDAVTLDAIDFTGSRVDYIGTKSDAGSINNTNNTAMLYALVLSEAPIAPGEGLFATLKFHIDKCSAPVVIDTAFIAPAGHYVFADMSGNPVPTPFTSGSITVLPGDLNVVLTPDHFNFEGTIGDPNPDCQTLHIATDFCGDPQFVQWNVASKPSWASVNPAAGHFPADAQVCVDIAGLAPGTYYDSIVVFASELPATVPPMGKAYITLVVHDQQPMIVFLDEPLFVLEAKDCDPGSVAQAKLHIANGGGGALNWSAIWDAPWLTLVPGSGTAPSEVTITVNGLGMPADTYVDSVLITAAGASNSPQYVIVHMTVTACPQGDTVWVGSGSGGLGADVVIPVTFENTQILSGLSVPLKYSSAKVKAVSGDFTGSRVDYLGIKIVTIDAAARTICIAAVPTTEPLIPAGKGLLVNLHFTVMSNEGCPEPIIVQIDSNYIPPGCEFMFADEHANAVYPEFFPGSIEITCPGGIDGTVGDGNGNPIPGCVQAWTSYPDGQIVGTDCAGDDGKFDFPDLPDGCYDLRAVLKGYCTVVLKHVCAITHGLEIAMDAIAEPAFTPFVADYWGTNATLEGHVLMPGDVITAKDPQGVVCGVAYVEQPGYYLIHVYGDDTLSTPGVDEGAKAGDIITFEINCGCPFTSVHPWINHASFHEELAFECVCEREQEIELCGNWTLMSYNVEVENQSIESVLAPIYSDLEQVIGSICEVGARTWEKNRAPELNDLHAMDNLHGYWIYAPGPVALAIFGTCIPANTPINLCETWNLISYLPNDADDLGHALGSVAGEYTYAFGFDCTVGAQTYDPRRPDILNDLVCLKPGHGYWLKMTEAATLTYPTSGYACTEDNNPQPKVVNLTGTVKPTPWVSDFWSYGSAGGPAKGSVLTVRDEQRTICGQTVVLDGGMFLVHVYGDDPNTQADEGAADGSQLTFESNGVQFGVDVTGGDRWTERLSNLITLSRPTDIVEGEGGVPNRYSLAQNYPNPFNPYTTIRFQMPNQMHVTLSVYNVLGQKVRTLVDDVLPAGEHQVEWNGQYDNGQRAESGVYFYRLSTTVFTDVRKMTLLK